MEELNELKQAAIDQPAREKKKKGPRKIPGKNFGEQKEISSTSPRQSFGRSKKKFP